jgi:hypothetical protein
MGGAFHRPFGSGDGIIEAAGSVAKEMAEGSEHDLKELPIPSLRSEEGG